ncbi:baseplate J/gp47 family protein [Pasteurellaceae bacterium HPA106]|uniref:baseplate assembly protein n=1 Tax=Spirabiliibacterium pneumoniae TaxID=221400 RepID=UPI001AAE1637|nr:baseplate J/gp47 family protein [Spirabiliibacterium pneumoniae]MBE2896729.1 baseplate J/gp47 family protein [Spirabiliibacterium pneumoniae]
MKKQDVKIVHDNVKKILADSIADYEQRTGKTLQPAHIERLIIQTYAYRELLIRKGINEAFLQTFPQFATDLALDLCGEPFGCYRLRDKAARCVLRFSVSEAHDSILIPKGTQVAVTPELYFSTLTDDVITPLINYVEIEAQANLTGNIGNNWEIGRVKQLKSRLNTDKTVTVANIDVTSGGIASEDDEAYRERILAAPEAFSTCGSIAAYQYHTRAVSQAIVDVQVINGGGGKVNIYPLTVTGVPDLRLKNDITAYLSPEHRRPLCDVVTVKEPIVRAYQIVAELTLLDGYREDIVKTKARDALLDYLAKRTKRLGLDVVPSALMQVLRVEGVYDVVIRQPSKMVIQPTEWANCTKVTITVAGERQDG